MYMDTHRSTYIIDKNERGLYRTIEVTNFTYKKKYPHNSEKGMLQKLFFSKI